MNFKHYKIRCSSLPKIVGAKGQLTQSAESYLKDLYVKEVYGRQKTLSNKYLTKGNEQEDASISLYRKVNQIFTQKNELKYANDFIEGTPDLILESRKKIVIDIKTCWDIWTYIDKDRKTAKKDYFWQVAGYSMLTGINKVQIAYTLLNNSEYEIYRQYEKAKWNLQIMEDGTEDTSEALLQLEDTVRKNNIYDDIPNKERVKVFNFTITPSDYILIKEYVEMSREYLNGLKL